MQAEEGVLQDENDSPHNDLNVRKTRLKMNFSTNRGHGFQEKKYQSQNLIQQTLVIIYSKCRI